MARVTVSTDISPVREQIATPPQEQPVAGALTQFAGAASDVLGTIGDELAETERKVSLRDDAVSRARAKRDFSNMVNAEGRRIALEEDQTDQNVGIEFNNMVNREITSALDAHTGSPDSRAALEQTLIGIGTASTDAFAITSVAAKRALLDDSIAQDTNDLALEAQQNPAAVLDLLDKGNAIIDDIAPGRTPDQTRDDRALMLQTVVDSSVTTMINSGNLEGAVELLALPGIAGMLGSSKTLTATTRIRKIELDTLAEANKGAIAGLNAITKFETIVGRPATGDEKLDIAGVSRSVTEKTLADKIIDLEAAQGATATQQQIDKLAGTFVARKVEDKTPAEELADIETILGRSLTETERLRFLGLEGKTEGQREITVAKARGTVSQMQRKILSGQASQAEIDLFISSASRIVTPTITRDPVTGAEISRTIQSLTPSETSALNSTGFQVSKDGRIVAIEQPIVIIPSATTVEPASVQPPEPAAATQPVPGAVQPDEDIQQQLAGVEVGRDTLFNLIQRGTGIIKGVQRTAGGLPIVGPLFSAEDEIEAKKFVEGKVKQLTDIMRQSPRFANLETSVIKPIVDFELQFFTNTNAALAEFRAIGKLVEDAIRESQIVIDNERSPAQDVRVAQGIVTTATAFLEDMGIPPEVNTVEELNALPSGTPYFDATINEYRTRGGQ